jgi:hypothetical protein
LLFDNIGKLEKIIRFDDMKLSLVGASDWEAFTKVTEKMSLGSPEWKAEGFSLVVNGCILLL